MAALEGAVPDGAVSGLAMGVEYIDRAPMAAAEGFKMGAYTYSGRQMVGAHAGVTLGKAKAAVSALEVGVNGPSVGTGVSAGWLTGLQAGVKMEVARAEVRTPIGSVATGLNFNTGATITPSSIGGKVAGFGISIGPLGVKLSCPLLEVAIGATEDGDV